MPETTVPPALFLVIYIWSLIIKGVALWRASNLKQRNWFVAILILNTIGLLEMFFLFKFATKKLTLKEIKTWLPSNSK